MEQNKAQLQEELSKMREQLHQVRPFAEDLGPGQWNMAWSDSLVRLELDIVHEQREKALQHAEGMRKQAEEMRREVKDMVFSFDSDFPAVPGRPNLSSAIERELHRDGLIQDASSYKLELSGKGWLKVNGKKQPAALYEKYRKLYEDATGTAFTAKSHILIYPSSEGRKR